MSKSFRKTADKKGRHEYSYDDEEDMFTSKSSYKERRQKRRLNNAIRSKNIETLMELDDEEYDG
jgi:hypothetical protein